MITRKNLIEKFEELMDVKVLGKSSKEVFKFNGINGQAFADVQLLSTNKGMYIITDNSELALIACASNTLPFEVLEDMGVLLNIYYMKVDAKLLQSLLK